METETSGGRPAFHRLFIQIAKFIAFSCTAGILQVLVFTLLTQLARLPYWPAYLTALVLSVLYNFTVNRRFTFKATANVPVAMLKILLYYAIFTPVSTIAGNYAADVLLWNEYLVLGISMLLNVSTEFMVYRLFVYNR
jgi:putative flippase GtrA